MVLCASVAALYFGFESYQRLRGLQQTVEMQRERNTEQRLYVDALRREVHSVQTDRRALEKAARNELGMARPNEFVVVFGEKK